MTPITVAPNINSAPVSFPYTEGLPIVVDEWQLYRAHVDAMPGPPDDQLRLAIEAGAVKEFDCDGSTLILEIPGHVELGAAVVALDEPLVAALRPTPAWSPYGTVWPHNHCYEIEALPDVAATVARYIVAAHEAGLLVRWTEALPQIPPPIWLDALTIAEGLDARPDQIAIDYDPHAGCEPENLGLDQLRGWCDDRGVDLVAIVMGAGATDNETFLGRAWLHWRELATLVSWDRVIVQSWLPDHAVPATNTLVRIAQQIRWFEEAGVDP